ncbi:MAG: hypothetical protein KAI47_10035 [Deltaproteobacteria bacterium]|nr:hypothetical protein [Deltaproteobacteria bacterium]
MFAALASGGCLATDTLSQQPGKLPPSVAPARFADVATCISTHAGEAPPACPGPSCAENATSANEPDSAEIDLARCTLDLIFTRGTVYTPEILVGGDGGRPDLVVHLGAQVHGSARIEASNDGVHYTLVGFINAPPIAGGAESRCIARCVDRRCTGQERCADGHLCDADGFCYQATCKAGGEAVIDLSAGVNSAGCDSIAQVHHLRLSHFRNQATGVSIDAIEALARAFCPNNDATCGVGH